MVKIRSLRELRLLPDGAARRAMEANAVLCHGGDEEVLAQMEEEFDGPLGGDWYLFEDGDDPRSFPFSEEEASDLLDDEWRWCDVATLEGGCFFVFWGTNNAGGPCLFVPDEPWVPAELRTRLEEFVAREGAA
jgi:hypothetical protein